MTAPDNGATNNLAAMRLPELRKLAVDMGLRGTSTLRKGDLIAAIVGAGAGNIAAPAAEKPVRRRRATTTDTPAAQPAQETATRL